MPSTRVGAEIEPVTIRDDEVDVPTKAQSPIAREARECREIVRFLAHAVLIEVLDRGVYDLGWVKVIE